MEKERNYIVKVGEFYAISAYREYSTENGEDLQVFSETYACDSSSDLVETNTIVSVDFSIEKNLCSKLSLSTARLIAQKFGGKIFKIVLQEAEIEEEQLELPDSN
jgi:hypothetical protein